jgi:hypothetical protein
MLLGYRQKEKKEEGKKDFLSLIIFETDGICIRGYIEWDENRGINYRKASGQSKLLTKRTGSTASWRWNATEPRAFDDVMDLTQIPWYVTMASLSCESVSGTLPHVFEKGQGRWRPQQHTHGYSNPPETVIDSGPENSKTVIDHQ